MALAAGEAAASQRALEVSEPPLYDLFCGALLDLPASMRAGTALVLYLGLGAAMAVATLLLLIDLRVPRWLSVTGTLLVVGDPSMVLYEQWLSWSYPTAALLVIGTLGLVRLARTGAARWAAVSAGCFCAVALLDTTFQWPWLLWRWAPLPGRAAFRLRSVARAACLPVVLVASWCLNDAIQFGTPSTSSWLGMNLAETTLSAAPTSDIAKLIRDGRLDQLASIPPFHPVGSYEPRYFSGKPTGVPALDQPVSELGQPNFNNAVYLSVSARYLRDDLAYLAARPGRYLSNVTVSAELWSIPADQYMWLAPTYGRISGYARFYDEVVLLQPRFSRYRPSVAAVLHAAHPPPADLSWTIVGVTLIDLIAPPWALYRRRRDTGWAVPVALLWVTVTYSFVVTTATEMSENMRFHFELGTLPVVLAVATVAAFLRRRGAAGSVPAVDVAGPPRSDVDA